MFKIYKTTTDFLLSERVFANAMTRVIRETKKGTPTDEEVMLSTYSTMARKAYFEMGDLEAVQVMMEEMVYGETGTKIIFPESEALLDSLRVAKFDLSKGHIIDFPFNSFSMAMPNNYERDGIKFMPMLISWMTGDEYEEKVAVPFEEITGLRINHPTDKDEKQLCVTIMTGEGDVKIRFLVGASEVANIVNAKNAEDYLRRMRDVEKVSLSSNMTMEDTEFQYHHVRLAMSYAIYNAAMGGLESGLPNVKIQQNKVQRDRGISGYTLKNKFKGTARFGTPTYRPPHFRQLRDERFYRTPEWQNKPRGSRWVEVSSFCTGGKADNYTQTDQGVLEKE